MKSIVFLMLAVSSSSLAQTDSIVVERTDGTCVRYSVSAIREIAFSGTPTSVRDQELIHAALSSFALYQNFPNPFNPVTTIQYEIPRSGEVTVAIYDIRGRLVRSLSQGAQQVGRHTVMWDGRNNHGVSASSGTYLCRVDFDHSSLITKLILLK